METMCIVRCIVGIQILGVKDQATLIHKQVDARAWFITLDVNTEHQQNDKNTKVVALLLSASSHAKDMLSSNYDVFLNLSYTRISPV